MSSVLTERNQKTIRRAIQTGRWNNQSEVLRYSVHLLEKELETVDDYLHPPPLAPGTLDRVYKRQSRQEQEEERHAVKASLRPGQLE